VVEINQHISQGDPMNRYIVVGKEGVKTGVFDAQWTTVYRQIFAESDVEAKRQMDQMKHINDKELFKFIS